jgi:sRNA-binding carbon storage regulator CsrA
MEEHLLNLGESFYVGDNTVLTVLSIDGDEIQFGINTLSEVSDKWVRANKLAQIEQGYPAFN